MFLRKQLLGMDLGSHQIKAAQLSKKGDVYKLRKFGTIHIPGNTIVDGSIMNTYEINDAIKTMLAREKIRAKHCAIAIAGHGIINRMIDMPKVDDSDFGDALRIEAESHVPHDIDEIYFDGIKTGLVDENKGKVILIAARKDLLGDFVQVVNDSGVKPMSVEIDASALTNIFLVNYPEEMESSVGLLNIGASKTNIVVISNGNMAFYRDIPRGGNHITEEITRKLKVSFQQAESLKSGEQIAGDSILPNQVEDVVSEIAEDMVADIRRVFDYYKSLGTEDDLSKTYITGGTTKSNTFTEVLKSKMDMEVEQFNPFREIVVPGNVLSSDDMEKNMSIASISLGLALRRLDES
ncbi:MAG: type IV pilus assembly protein PilM [bacterium]